MAEWGIMSTAFPNTTPIGPVPTPRQIRHHAREFYGFLHFTINTFTDKEWGYGDESPDLFNPTDFDAGTMARIARDAGMAGLILTCKHHDGFCLWPTETTKHSVASSPFRGGKGDVVRELADACREAGIGFGVYLSPWDRNHPLYGTPEYVVQVYRPQLRELLTNYGPIFEVWFDGANGGDGYYGGAREHRAIDSRTYYDWPGTWTMVRELQPDAVMFSDGGPDVRWVGNEDGIAGDPCWATMVLGDTVPGHADSGQLNRGDRDGDTWLIPECDVSIRPGWFWHELETPLVRSVKNLADLYFHSVGRGANLLLNLPPDRRGRIPEPDVDALMGLRSHLDALFSQDLAGDAVVSPAPLDGVNAAHEITLDLPAARTVNVVRLREHIEFGQRVDSWALDVWTGGEWREVAAAQSIGARRLVRFSGVTADRFRVRIASAVPPALAEVSLFFEPPIAQAALVSGQQQVAIIETAGVAKPDEVTIVFDLGAGGEDVAGFVYDPYAPRGHVADKYVVSVSDDGSLWREIQSGEFANVQANPIRQIVTFDTPRSERFIRFQGTHFVAGDVVVLSQVQLISARQ